MSKTNPADILDVIEELAEFEEHEEWQLEYSYEQAQAWVDQTMAELYEFDVATTDENYYPGCATYGLFIALVPKLAEMGYSVQELTQEIEANMAAPIDETLH